MQEILQYALETIRRVERKVEVIDNNQNDLARKLESVTRKQEMLLTKQAIHTPW